MATIFHQNVLKADINISSSGDNTIIAAPSEGYIAIDHINFLPTDTVEVQFKDGATNYGGPYPLDAKQAFVLENAMASEKGVITASAGEAFIMNLDAAVQVGGFIRYRVVGA